MAGAKAADCRVGVLVSDLHVSTVDGVVLQVMRQRCVSARILNHSWIIRVEEEETSPAGVIWISAQGGSSMLLSLGNQLFWILEKRKLLA